MKKAFLVPTILSVWAETQEEADGIASQVVDKLNDSWLPPEIVISITDPAQYIDE